MNEIPIKIEYQTIDLPQLDERTFKLAEETSNFFPDLLDYFRLRSIGEQGNFKAGKRVIGAADEPLGYFVGFNIFTDGSYGKKLELYFSDQKKGTVDKTICYSNEVGVPRGENFLDAYLSRSLDSNKKLNKADLMIVNYRAPSTYTGGGGKDITRIELLPEK